MSKSSTPPAQPEPVPTLGGSPLNLTDENRANAEWRIREALERTRELEAHSAKVQQLRADNDALRIALSNCQVLGVDMLADLFQNLADLLHKYGRGNA